MAEPDVAEPAAPKKASPVITIAIVAVLTLLAGGGGWVVGGMLAPPPMDEATKTALAEFTAAKEAEAAAEKAKPAEDAHGGDKKKEEEEGLPHISTEANGVVQLEPITTNLAFPSENWVRIEVALQFKGAADVTISEQIHQDIVAYMRTVSLQQIQGTRGFQYLKDDIQERVDLRSEGRVTNVMFRTFVIQ